MSCEQVWPKIAAFFDMPVGTPMKIELARFMADKAPVWERITKANGLQTEVPYDKLVTWAFFDFNMNQNYGEWQGTMITPPIGC